MKLPLNIKLESILENNEYSKLTSWGSDIFFKGLICKFTELDDFSILKEKPTYISKNEYMVSMYWVKKTSIYRYSNAWNWCPYDKSVFLMDGFGCTKKDDTIQMDISIFPKLGKTNIRNLKGLSINSEGSFFAKENIVDWVIPNNFIFSSENINVAFSNYYSFFEQNNYYVYTSPKNRDTDIEKMKKSWIDFFETRYNRTLNDTTMYIIYDCREENFMCLKIENNEAREMGWNDFLKTEPYLKVKIPVYNIYL